MSVSELPTDFVLGGTLALRGAVLAGLGIAFLPRRAIGQELAEGRLKIVEESNFRVRRTFSWVTAPGPLPWEMDDFRRWANARMR